MVDTPCALCGLPVHHPVKGTGEDVYCCASCREVAQLLAEEPGTFADKHPTSGMQPGKLAGTTLSISGLYCASCAWLVEERLKRTPGVYSAQVNFIRREAQLEYDTGQTTPRKLSRRVRSLGYKAQLAGQAGQEDEEDAFFTRLLIGGMLAMHIMVTSLIIYVRGILGLNTIETSWLEAFFYLMQFVVVIPLLLVLGLPVLRAGIASLVRGLPNTHTLVTLGVVSAVVLSTRNFLTQNGHVYFDTAAMLLFLMTIGRWLEIKAHKSSQEAIEKLLIKMPTQVIQITPNGDREIPFAELKTGMRIRVLPGSFIPVDGLVAAGAGDVDESLLTGEPTPVFHQENDTVWAGTLNLDGVIEIIALTIGEQTRAGQISHLLQQAIWSRSPIERLADKLAAWLIPAALTLASATFIFWFFRTDLDTALLHALSVLLIACPCALGLATPLTLWQGLTRAAQNGIVLRSTSVLEQITKVKNVFFDKTGTLTRLPMQIQSAAAVDMPEDQFLQMVAAAEAASEHPIARAIVAEAKNRGLIFNAASTLKALPGKGITAIVNDTTIHAGKLGFLQAEGFTLPPNLQQAYETSQAQGFSVVFAGWNGKVQGMISLGETIRPEAVTAIRSLHKAGKSIALLTGDDIEAGKRWSRLLALDVFAGLSPEEKLTRVNAAAPAAMVGDGINDGPALAAAAVGISFASGTDLARAASEVILVRDDLRTLPWLLELADKTRLRVMQNLGWALIYNLVGIFLAMGGVLQPELAALAMVLSSLLVTRNALQLKHFPLLHDVTPAVDTAASSAPGSQRSYLNIEPVQKESIPS